MRKGCAYTDRQQCEAEGLVKVHTARSTHPLGRALNSNPVFGPLGGDCAAFDLGRACSIALPDYRDAHVPKVCRASAHASPPASSGPKWPTSRRAPGPAGVDATSSVPTQVPTAEGPENKEGA